MNEVVANCGGGRKKRRKEEEGRAAESVPATAQLIADKHESAA